jgi:hypothetical protein
MKMIKQTVAVNNLKNPKLHQAAGLVHVDPGSPDLRVTPLQSVKAFLPGVDGENPAPPLEVEPDVMPGTRPDIQDSAVLQRQAERRQVGQARAVMVLIVRGEKAV